ncbi:DoxX family protein [bacterium]|nr:DoxX family protein [bacterium]
MKKMKDLIDWIEKHRDWCFDLMRIYLGIGLLVKGIYFLWQPDYVASLVMESGNYSAWNTLLVHYVAMGHIAGGLLMAIGMITRIGAAIQLPILFGAVFLVHLKEGLFSKDQSLEFSALVLFLVCLITIYGSGTLSVDSYLDKKKVNSI